MSIYKIRGELTVLGLFTLCGLKEQTLWGSTSHVHLQDSTPLVIYVAAYEGIRLLEVDGAYTNYSSPIQTPTSAMRIDLLYSRDEIVFKDLTGTDIYKSFFGHQLNKYSMPLKFEVITNEYGLAIDWFNQRIYFCQASLVMENDLLNQNSRPLFASDSLCIDLAIDPYTRTLFTVFYNGTLVSFSLLNNDLYTFKGGKYDLQKVRRVALDYKKQLIYVIASLTADNGTYFLVKMDYTDTVLTILLREPKLGWSYGLDVFEDSVVWDEWNKSASTSTLNICKMTPTCKQEDVSVLHTISENIEDIIIYHPVIQTPTERFLCMTKGCSHNCSKVTLFAAECNCPEGLILGIDSATCQEVLRTESMTVITTAVTEIRSSTLVPTMALSPDSKSFTNVSTNESSTFTMATMSSSADLSKTSTTSAPTSSDHGPKINLFITFSVVSLVLVSLLLMAVIAQFIYFFRYHNSAYTVQPQIELRPINHEHCEVSNLLE